MDGDSGPAPDMAAFLPRLERYLPPYLWEKARVDSRRGVVLNMLERLRSVLYLLSTYLPSPLVQEVLCRPEPGWVRGQILGGTLLFADVSGFTALSERLSALERPTGDSLFELIGDPSPEGIERLTAAINRYLERMLEILAWSGGILLKFAGDALLAYFPEQEGGEQARRAARAAQRMMQAMGEFSAIPTPHGPATLRMKVGLATGPFLAASVGTARRMEYVVLGETVSRTLVAESTAEAGLVVADAATAAALGAERGAERAPGLFAVPPIPGELLGTFEIGPGARRRGGAAPWIAGTAEIAAELQSTLRQVEALAPYLPDVLVERIVAGAQQRRLESDFRPATVLFLNLAGLEEMLAGGAAPAEVTARLNDAFNAIQATVARYDGIVSRIDPYKWGSKVLILFGAPVAHEDDPQRAARAALTMRQELAAQMSAPPIELRGGIAQGVTFAGQCGSATRREYTVMGDDVNLAARLMAAARPGQVLLSQSVHQAVQDTARTAALPPIQVKGKAQPVPIYELTGLREDRLARRLRTAGPFVGRGAELARLRAALAAALAGRGAIVTIEGPAGVGKSRLADALAAEAQAAGALVLLLECPDYAAESPYTPWIALVEAAAGSGPADSTKVRAQKVRRRLLRLGLGGAAGGPLLELLGLPVAPEEAMARPAVVPTAAHPAETRPSLFARLEQQVEARPAGTLDLWKLTGERHSTPAGRLWQRLETRLAARERARLFAALGRFLQRLAAEAPLVLLLENAQWLDTASRDLFAHLQADLAGRPVLALLLQRSAEGPGAPPVGEVLGLAPLGPEETAALARHLVGEAAGQQGEALVRLVQEQSGGNPLFVEELVRRLRQAGGDRAALESLPRAGTLRELVLGRLDALPPPAREVAKTAAVIGDEFSRSDLRALREGGAGGDQDEETGLAGLEEAQLIVPRAGGADPAYAFRHALLREAIYSSLSFARRRALHAGLAAHLEARCLDDPTASAGESLAAHAELLAHHYEQAGQFLPAARYLLIAGQKARQRYALAQAGAAYRRALAGLDRLLGQEADFELQVLYAQARAGQGDLVVLEGDFTAAVGAYAEAGVVLLGEDVVEYDRARFLLKYALVLPMLGQAEAALSCARQAAALAAPGTELAAAATIAWLLQRAGEPEAEHWLERAAELAAREPGRWSAGVAALLADLRGDWAAARAAYLEVDRLAAAALAACRLGDRHLAHGETAAALALYLQAAGYWQEEDDAAGLALARYRQAEVHGRQGEREQAAALLQEALDLLEQGAGAPDEDRATLAQAHGALEKGLSTWPAWRWQHYVDALYVTLLFHP